MKGTDGKSIQARLCRLSPPSRDDSLRMFRLRENLSAGRFGDGSASLFFDLATPNLPASRRLTKGLELIESSDFSLVDRRGRVVSRRSGYALVLKDPTRVDRLATIGAHAAERLRIDPAAFSTRSKVDSYVAEWVEFFALGRISLEEAIGLWGELYLLTLIGDAEVGVSTWVGPFRQMFDFVGHGVSLEVKTSLRSSRSTFSLEQIEGRDEGHCVFVRVLRDDLSGRTLDDLVATVRGRLTNVAQFDAALMRTGFTPGDHPELKLTAHEVRAISNASIPRPIVKDLRIVGVRYVVDVDGIESHGRTVDKLLAALAGAKRRNPRLRTKGNRAG